MKQTFRNRQYGLSVVELMIAMVLGLLLIAGVVQIFLSGRASYRVQEGLGSVQENGRFADFFLARTLRLAGLPRNMQAPFFQAIDTRPDDSTLPATRDGGGPGGTGPDVITVMYRSPTNCFGFTTDYPGGEAIRDFRGNLYAKDQFFLNNDDPPSLMCRNLGLSGLPVASQPIVRGVDDFQVLYGIDTDGDGLPNSFTNASAIVPPLTMNQVVSLRYALLVNSDRVAKIRGSGGGEEHRNKIYTVLDAPRRGPYDDDRLRQVFTTTLELRNRTP